MREVRSQGKLLPSNWRGRRRMRRITTSQSRNLHLSSRKAWTITDELLETQYRQVWELETPEIPSHWWGGGITFMGFTYRSSTKCIKWISGKNLFMLLARGGEKELFLNTPEHSVLLNKSLLSEDILPEPIWGKENIQPQAPPAIQSHPSSGGKLRSTCEIHSPGVQVTKRVRPH